MKEIKVATVFSGIGAPEQALKRLNVKHKIIFACDNGERLVNLDKDQIVEKMKGLKSSEEKRIFVDELYKTRTRKTNFVQISYLANYKVEKDNFFQDVTLLDGSDFKNKVDFFIGGSPCQSFSIAGHRGGFEDTRGTLFHDYARLIKQLQPKVFIYENVYGVLNHDKGQTWKIMQNVFSELGYYFKWQIMDAKNYGMPQSRRRLFVVGFKDKKFFEKFEFPKSIELEHYVQYFLEDNAAIGSILNVNGKLQHVNDEKGYPADRYFLSPKILKYVTSPGTKKFYHENAETNLKVARALLSTMGNSHRASVDNYYTTDGRLRRLTEREAHRLMGFPDDYKIEVSVAQAYKQAGNSIVVDVLMYLFKEIFKTEVFD
jgi:DNA (cytosine-5)-methyltransferase 1